PVRVSNLTGPGFLDASGTPSVSGVDVWQTTGVGSITNFDDGHTMQMITILAEHIVQIMNNANIWLAGNTDFTMNPGDTLTLVKKSDGVWTEVCRSDNT